MEKHSIKNIIFDLGGIFIDVDYQKTSKAFIDLGITNFDDYYRQSFSNPLFAQLEKGQITAAVFYEAFRQMTNSQLTNTQIETAWSAMLGRFRKSSVAILPQVKQRFKIFLLSNINEIHYKTIANTYEAQFGNNDFDSYFIKPYYSHLCNERKPDAAAYEMIVAENGLLKEETLFVDDTMKNIAGAQAVGLQVLWVKQDQLVEDALQQVVSW